MIFTKDKSDKSKYLTLFYELQMFKSFKSRIFIILILALILFSLFVWYGAIQPDPEQGSFPNEKQLVQNYDDHINKKAEISGKVVDTDPLTIETSDYDLQLVIRGTNEIVNKGDRLSVFGTVEEGRTIRAENVVVHPYLNYIYLYLISVVSAAWIFIRIVKQWRWNSKESKLEQREEPLRLKQFFKGSDNSG